MRQNTVKRHTCSRAALVIRALPKLGATTVIGIPAHQLPDVAVILNSRDDGRVIDKQVRLGDAASRATGCQGESRKDEKVTQMHFENCSD